MTRLCIAFDRLRAEEKMLKSEAESLGCRVLMLDAKTAASSTDSAPGDVIPGGGCDVVLERCVSYFRGLHMTSVLESLDVRVINAYEVAAACGNKMIMTLRLKRAGVSTPKTHFAFSAEAAESVMKDAGYPLVIKPVVGSWGRGVIPIRGPDTLAAILEARSVTDGPFDRIFYLQEVIRRSEDAEGRTRDIRVITVGGEPVSAMYRMSAGGGFRANLALGGDPVACSMTPEMAELASAASDAVGGGILGVDMMEREDGRLVVHEVNNTVEFKGLSRVSERNIPKAMVQFAVDAARK
ncbi:MAG: RimK family alpha-L-glutamate ligase [Thaumarchaeota archaeon]|nr:RimK family alpha-L-glutamate ligase [Nitrososphaerota archaeon]